MAEDGGNALIARAREAALHAYAPYSQFAVGAAILLTDGGVVTGANVENSSYGLSLCAETVAVASANIAGRLADIVAIAVIGGRMESGAITGSEPIRPCGRCRQILDEAATLGGRDIIVYCASADGELSETHMLSALLPHGFRRAS